MLGVSLIGEHPPNHFVSGRDGWFLEDVDGNRYLDWINGWASARSAATTRSWSRPPTRASRTTAPSASRPATSHH